MPSYKIIMTGRAREDLIDIGDYISYTLCEPEIALNFIKNIRKEMETLTEYPERQPYIDDEVLASQGIRCLSYKNYFIFYDVDKTTHKVLFYELVIIEEIGKIF
ncbi:MAG: type II toxin-antitoxin system RelE/ParE family toxin [Anaerocolumna sp.]